MTSSQYARAGGRRPAASWAALLVLVFAAIACGGEDAPAPVGLADASELAGRNVGVVEIAGSSTVITRFVLQEKYGLNVDLAEGDVTLIESPADSLTTLLNGGVADAVVVSPMTAFALLEEDGARVLTEVTAEMRELTGVPVMASILVANPDVVERKPGALDELNSMLVASMAYFVANRDAVIAAVAEREEADEGFLQWWWDRWDLSFGDLSEERQGQLVAFWEAALAVGDMVTMPALEAAMFTGGGEEQEDAIEGDRETVSLALLDDPSRRAAMYAIEQGIVVSETIDLDLTYLPPSQIAEAAPAVQFDVIETSPLAVPGAAIRDLTLIVLSGGLIDLDGTLLFVPNEPEER